MRFNNANNVSLYSLCEMLNMQTANNLQGLNRIFCKEASMGMRLKLFYIQLLNAAKKRKPNVSLILC